MWPKESAANGTDVMYVVPLCLVDAELYSYIIHVIMNKSVLMAAPNRNGMRNGTGSPV